ncbi:hypothetical protein D3C86_679310 [compost metagenome]
MTSTPFSWRKLFLNLHLWLGLASGLIVVILCLSGTLLALQGPIESWVNRDVLQVQAVGDRQPLEALVPQVTRTSEKPFTAVVVMPGETDALQFMQGRKATYVNPYTGEVLGGFNSTVSEAFMTVFRLHRWLLLETPVGRPITGAATVVFLFVLMTGLVIWWPKRLSGLKRALLMRSKVNWKGRNYDLHVVLGFYALIPLAIMGASALYWSYNPAFKQVVYATLDGRSAPEQPQSQGPAAEGRGRGETPPLTDLPYARLLEQTQAAYPHRGPVRITFPKNAEKPVEVAKTHAPHAFSLPYVDRLQLDATTGEIVTREPFAEKSRAEKLLSLIKHIHLGTVYGGLSLTIYVLACLVGTTLPITGFIHWFTKQKALRPRTPKVSQPVEAVATSDAP